ncbi:peptidase M16 [Idiomarina sp. WRN-38]|uniref:M16 family metallopeptidase n=1 Tax=Idiomarina sp. OXR-189 TaxID=3100175 RepID=UPI000733426E|nr:pitrilysin family protein [Idiomarina sp. OXR-189]KTG23445.1 peptidase M16 [Idiomarina sp. H105]OAE90837.1 peptidase M16 [Idiomarina sp. WRN-38]WPZ00434.1 pitrilysin family protein [Idiomarina sp. OXR-189]|tara:strand:- start:3445 stop:6216 length:2772 start_codon:yes stop_codon:yes gene_type:complete
MKMMKTLTAVAVTTVLLGGCQSTSSANNTTAVSQSQFPEVKVDYETFTLDNGLTVVVHEDRKAPIVAVNVWYAVGSKDEKPGKTGFAHLFEHLMFNGTENYDDEYFGPFERAGATEMNGTTNNDRTNYFENVPTPALDMALWMESDRMGHLLGAVTQEKLDEQRGVVQNEKRQGEAQPYGKAWSYISEQTFPEGHPYSWSVIGSMEDLNAATLDDVHQWFKDYYGAANAVLVLAGDIDVETAKEKVTKYFADIGPGKPLKKQEAWVAKRNETKRATMEDRVPAARVYKVWNTAQMGTADSEYLELFADILANGKNSRLYERLVYEEQIASSVGAFQYGRTLAGQFMITADAKAGVELEQIEAIINEELERLINEGPTQAELQRTKFSNTANFVRRAEKVGGFGGKSDILASGAVYHDNPGFYAQEMEWTKQATVSDVQNAAQQWLSSGDFVLNVVPQPNYTAQETDADRSELPNVGDLPQLELPEVEQFTLSNGLDVYLAQRTDTPTIEMSLVFDSGYASDVGGKLGTASYTMSMLKEGTESLSSLELSERLESLGTNLNASASLDSSRISMDTLSVNFAESLGLMNDVLQNPAFSEEEIERKRSNWIEGIRKEEARPQTQALRVLPGLMFGDGHAYSQPLTGSGTVESIKSLTRDDLVEHAQTWLRPDNAKLVIVGDTTVEQAKSLLEEQFASWQAPATPKPEKTLDASAASDENRVFLIDKPGTPQSLIIAGQLAPSGQVDNADTVDVMNTILGGSFTSRLNMNLREDKGWSYGARSIWLDNEGPGLLMALAPVQTNKTQESIQEIVKEFTQYEDDKPATDDELAKVKANKTAKLPGAYETKGALLGGLVSTFNKGKDVEYLESYGQRINAITLDDIQQSADKVLTPNAMTWVIVGDLAEIEDKVRELNLGEVTILQSDEE